MTIDEAQVERWGSRFSDHGIGLRTGELVGLDIDILDPDHAHAVMQHAQRHLGATLTRVGMWPKRLLIYRTSDPFPKIRKLGGVEVLGAGQQFVAFGTHPDTRHPYYWLDDDTPLDVPLADLPVVTEQALRNLLTDCTSMPTAPSSLASRFAARQTPPVTSPQSVVAYDGAGQVTDGRDGWLSTIAYHTVQDAIDAGEPLDRGALADRAWRRFEAGTDLARPRKDDRDAYGPDHAARKIADKLRLHADGRLQRRPCAAQDLGPAPPRAPSLTVEAGRVALAERLDMFCQDVLDWHRKAEAGGLSAPRLGLRATVGLGKSTASRSALARLQGQLAAEGRPHRILIAVPSHRIAEEAARGWRDAGVKAAVLRGYEHTDPGSGAPMCRNIEAVRVALESGEPVPHTCCRRGPAHQCRFLDGCAKQRNKIDVATADVVIAPYDILRIEVDPDAATGSYGLLVVDEACWQRSIKRDCFPLSELRTVMWRIVGDEGQDRVDRAVHQTIEAVLESLQAHPGGPVTRGTLGGVGPSPGNLATARSWLSDRLAGSGLFPGAGAGTLHAARAMSRRNQGLRRLVTLLDGLASILDADGSFRGQVLVEVGKDDQVFVHIGRLAPIALAYAAIPLLHLDATLRPELAGCVLPSLKIETIDVAMPHMRLQLVQGRFGKVALCPSDTATPDHTRAAANRLEDLVAHVRWRARITAPGRTLVVTYKAIEDRFAGIPNVAVAHFNAIVGLDAYGDVAQIVVIGRPLPDPLTLAHTAGSLFRHSPDGSYAVASRHVRMRDGTTRPVRVLQHKDARTEVLRAAICDDELVQAIGRGRAVNRTRDTPLVIQVLADVALPLIHDDVSHWDLEAPDHFQKMLLAGCASDSPLDAAALHPTLFRNAEQAKKALKDVFKGKFLIETHKEISLKSAAYRREGRGRSWQRAWWIDDGSDRHAAGLAAVLGPLAGWKPVTEV